MKRRIICIFLSVLLIGIGGSIYAASWDKDKPAGSQKLRLADDDIRDNNDAIEDALSRDHDFPGTYGSDAGKHNKVTLQEQSSNPSTSANEAAVFTKESGESNTELYFRGESDATAIQVTDNDLQIIRREVVENEAIYVSDSNGTPLIEKSVFDVSTLPNVIEETWESVGPTGSGADNIWTGLDNIPTDVDWIKLKIIGSTIGSGYAGKLYARENGSSEAISQYTQIDYLEYSSYRVIYVEIPVSSRKFDIYWDAVGGSSGYSVLLFPVGYGWN